MTTFEGTTLKSNHRRSGRMQDMIIENGQEFTVWYAQANDTTYLCLNGRECISLAGKTDKNITRLWRTWGHRVKRFWQATYSPEAAAIHARVQAAFNSNPKHKQGMEMMKAINNRKCTTSTIN
jgi:hypothetical protein